jgi:uncharacterized protein
MRKSLLLAMAILTATAVGCDRPEQPPAGETRWAKVTIHEFTWRVEITDRPETQYLGLSGREGLADDEGMLFVYDKAKERSFCMREMTFPIDIAFISSDFRVVRIHTMAVEPDGRGDVPYRCYAPAQYVLEVNAGKFEELGIEEGDRVAIHR